MNSSAQSEYSYNYWMYTVDGAVRTWTISTAFPIALAIGMPGNLLILLYFVTLKSGLSKTSRMFFTAMAILDELIVVAYIPELVNYFAPRFAEVDWTVGHNLVLCKSLRYFWTLLETASDWILLVFTTERLFSVLRPLQARVIFTSRRTAVQLVVLVTLCCGASVTAALVYEPIRGDCAPIMAQSIMVLVHDILIFGCGFLLPTALQAICIVVMLLSLVKVARFRRSLAGNSQSHAVSSEVVSSCVTLLIVSSLHVVFYSAFFAVVLAFGVTVNESPVEQAKWVARIFITLYFCSIARCSNFIVLLLRTSAFRQAIKKQCC